MTTRDIAKLTKNYGSREITTAVKILVDVLAMQEGNIRLYKRNGGDWVVGAFLTKTPGEFTVAPQTPGNPNPATSELSS